MEAGAHSTIKTIESKPIKQTDAEGWGVTVSSIYLLKDLARLSGHSIHTLKFYLKLGLITEAGRSPETRFRYFSDATLERLNRIRHLQKEGNKLAEIKAIIDTPKQGTPQ